MDNETQHGKSTFRVVAALLAACATLVLAACGNAGAQGGENSQTGPIDVVASINQWGSLAQQIGGSDVNVTSIVNTTAVDAHDFDPKTGDVAKIQKAQVVVTNGAGYDQWATKSVTKNSLSVAADKVSDAKTGDNPHLWFSKDARQAMAASLKDAFSKQRPGKSKAFESRYKAWKSDEDALDRTIGTFASQHKGATYAATESVAYYLMHDMGMRDMTPKGYAQASASESEPAPADLQDFKSLLSSRKVTMLVNNTQESSDATNMLTGTAGRSEVPVVDVTEQMPKGQTKLTAWISDLVGKVDKASQSFEDSKASHQKVAVPDTATGTNDSAKGSAASQAPANTGGTDGLDKNGRDAQGHQPDPGK